MKNGTQVTLKLNMISSNKNIFPHKLLITNRQVENLHKAFTNNLSAKGDIYKKSW